MSRAVAVKVNIGGGSGRRLGGAENESAAPAPKVPRVARVLALAHHWNGLIQGGTVRDRADLARLVGVSRARVTQVMRLLDLAPDIQEAVLDGKVDGVGVEKVLRRVAEVSCWTEQEVNLRRTWTL